VDLTPESSSSPVIVRSPAPQSQGFGAVADRIACSVG